MNGLFIKVVVNHKSCIQFALLAGGGGGGGGGGGVVFLISNTQVEASSMLDLKGKHIIILFSFLAFGIFSVMITHATA